VLGFFVKVYCAFFAIFFVYLVNPRFPLRSVRFWQCRFLASVITLYKSKRDTDRARQRVDAEQTTQETTTFQGQQQQQTKMMKKKMLEGLVWGCVLARSR
jgi:hypothetical protein